MPIVDESSRVYLKDWRSSQAKQVLKKMIEEGRVTENSDAEVVYNSLRIFQNYKLTNFKTNLKNLIKSVKKDEKRVSRDEAALKNDIELLGRPSRTSAGKPIWAGSTAEELLKSDVERLLHLHMKPEQLWLSRNEYQRFELRSFRDRIYEIRSKKLGKSYWLNKQEKEKKKKQEIEALFAELNF